MVLARSTQGQAHRSRRQRRRLQRTLAALLALALHASVGVGAAHAQETDDFSLGYGAAQIGDFEQAVRHFSLAYERDGDPLALYNLAQAYAASGDPVLAAQTFEQLLALPSASAEQLGWAREALRVQRNRVGSVVLSVEPASAEVYLDGRLLTDDQRQRPLLAKVGEHTLLAKYGSNESPLRQFSVVSQQSTEVRLVVAGSNAATAPRPAGVDPVPDRRGPSNSLSWALGVTGAALCAGSGALWLAREATARGYNDRLKEISALNPASDEFIRRRRAAADDRGRVSAFGLAAALAGAGGLAALSVAWIAYESEDDDGPSARLSPMLTPSELGFSAVGSF